MTELFGITEQLASPTNSEEGEMYELIWKIRGAYRFRSRMGGWGWLDLRMAWRTADACYGAMIEDGDYISPEEAIDEELSCWSD